MRALPFALLLVSAARRAVASELAELYRDVCMPHIPPPDWNADEDGEWSAGEDYKAPKLCATQLTDLSFREQCAPHLPPSDWDVEEDGEFQPDPDLALPTCIVLFVPHLLDSGAIGRMELLGALLKAGQKVPKHPFLFMWSQAGAQPELEAALDISIYPKLALYSPRHEVGVTMAQALTAENIDAFFQKAAMNRLGGLKAVQVGTLNDAEEWDGADAAAETCEDPSYDDVELDGPL